MPIKGITDSVQAAFPRIGRLRKGGPKRVKDGKEYMGADLTYFRFVSDRPEVQAAFTAAYGDKPALINCYLPHAGIEDNFSTWKERWAAGGLVHRCDGETMVLWLGEDGRHYRTPKPCDGGCDEVGRLSLWIPELMRAGYIGYVTLETHGINDLLSIQASLQAGLETRGNNDLRGIEWRLYRIAETISTPLGPNAPGKRARREKWLVKLEPAPQWVALQIEAARAGAYRALPAPRVVDAETGEITVSKAVSPEELALELDGAEPPIDDIEPPEEGEDVAAPPFTPPIPASILCADCKAEGKPSTIPGTDGHNPAEWGDMTRKVWGVAVCKAHHERRKAARTAAKRGAQ